MEPTDLFIRAFVALAAIAGTFTAIFRWKTARERSQSNDSNKKTASITDSAIKIRAGRDVNVISDSFNVRIGDKDDK